jgi:SAM-dependent methyltransferase
VQDDPPVQMLECSACGGASASRMPTAEFLGHFYEDYYDHKRPQDRRVTFARPDRFAASIARTIRTAPRDAKILDLGGGDGSLSRALAERLHLDGGSEIVVCDYHRQSVEKNGRVSIRWVENLQDVAGSFDIVLASAVLEHIPDAGTTLSRLLEMVVPGGWLYARTPWHLPLRWVYPGVRIGFPSHVHDIGEPCWRYLASMHEAYELEVSRPSLLQHSFSQEPLPAIVGSALKLPPRITRRWPFVGGWEVMMRRRS